MLLHPKRRGKYVNVENSAEERIRGSVFDTVSIRRFVSANEPSLPPRSFRGRKRGRCFPSLYCVFTIWRRNTTECRRLCFRPVSPSLRAIPRNTVLWPCSPLSRNFFALLAFSLGKWLRRRRKEEEGRRRGHDRFDYSRPDFNLRLIVIHNAITRGLWRERSRYGRI